jgi:CRP/FNR family cyclic AMP-dependent transcriptional regulator
VTVAILLLVRAERVNHNRKAARITRRLRPSLTVLEPPGDRTRQQLLRLGTHRPFRRGELLMMAGSPSDEVLLIETGRVKVVLSAPDGSETIVGWYGPGELIGELGVMSGGPRSANVVAQRAGRALHVPGEVFRAWVDRDRDALVYVNEMLRKRLHNADRRRLALASRDVPGRVAAQLLDWARDHGEPQGAAVVVRGFTQRELAQTVTASEKFVDEVLRELRSAGLLETGRCRFTLLRPERLEELVQRP